MKSYFRDRTDAGRVLAERLKKYAGQSDVLILGLPRGGVPVAGEIARHLHAPLDVLVVCKLDLPCQEELAMGAIAPGGVCILNDDVIDRLDIEGDAIGAVRLYEERELERREELYRGIRPFPEVRDKTVIVVDDGIATSATMHAAVVFLLQQEVKHVIIATPVVSRKAFRELRPLVTEIVAVIVTDNFLRVGQWFEEFAPTTDDEVRRVLGTGDAQRVSP